MSAILVDQVLSVAGRCGTVVSAESNGQSYPLGATVLPGGVNFSVFSQNASRVDTSFDSPHDIVEWQTAPWETFRVHYPPVPSSVYYAEPRSVVILFAHAGDAVV